MPHLSTELEWLIRNRPDVVVAVEALLTSVPQEVPFLDNYGLPMFILRLQRHKKLDAFGATFIYSCSVTIVSEFVRKRVVIARAHTEVDAHGTTLLDTLNVVVRRCRDHRRLLLRVQFWLDFYLLDKNHADELEAIEQELAKGKTKVKTFDSFFEPVLCRVVAMRDPYRFYHVSVGVPISVASDVDLELLKRSSIRSELESIGSRIKPAILRLTAMCKRHWEYL